MFDVCILGAVRHLEGFVLIDSNLLELNPIVNQNITKQNAFISGIDPYNLIKYA